MNKIKILGIGAITALGTDIESIWEAMDQQETEYTQVGMISFSPELSSVQKRRMPRYSQMAVYTAQKACQECGLTVTEDIAFRVGSIYTTGFGPLVSNLEFAATMEKGDADLCSPTLFSSTVSNACVGQVCINIGCKGVSTLIMGSNNLGYSQMLIQKNDADYILTGSVEEYCDDLYRAFSEKNAQVNEAAITFVVANEKIETDFYAWYVDCRECNLGVYPLLGEAKAEVIKPRIKKLIADLVHNYTIDTVFLSGGSKWMDDIEKEILDEELPGNIKYVGNIKKIFGETLGCAYNLNVMVAALCLKKKRLPLSLDIEQAEVKCALVLGFDVSGNYIVNILER